MAIWTKKRAAFSGSIVGASCELSEASKSLVYIYAHKKTNLIANHILTRLAEGDERYTRHAFIFCGAGAVGSFNALHMGYLADADGITTAGAGTNGEFSYLHRQVKHCQARLLVLPIEGHNEQLVNRDYLSAHEATRDFVMSLAENDSLSSVLDAFFMPLPEKINSGITLADFLNAVADQRTYVAQACDILFKDSPLSATASMLRKLEEEMYDAPALKVTRRYLKIVFQGMLALQKPGQRQVLIWLSDKQRNSHKFDTLWELGMLLSSPAMLAKFFNVEEKDTVSLPLRAEISRLFMGGSKHWDKKVLLDIAHIKHEPGEYMVTGF